MTAVHIKVNDCSIRVSQSFALNIGLSGGKGGGWKKGGG